MPATKWPINPAHPPSSTLYLELPIASTSSASNNNASLSNANSSLRKSASSTSTPPAKPPNTPPNPQNHRNKRPRQRRKNLDGQRHRLRPASRFTREFLSNAAKRERSEECRVGKECRSRWSPYH